MSASAPVRGPAESVAITHEGLERIMRTLVFGVPPAALGLGAWLAWGGALHWQDLIVLVIIYTLTGIGITVGFHRLFTHRSFKTTRRLRALLAVLGSMAVEGPVIEWVSTHRKHHRFSDQPATHTAPTSTSAPGWRGALRGLGHAHVGWMFRGKDMANPARYAKDLLADRDLRFISRTFPLWVLVGLALPFGLGLALTGSVIGGLTGLLWGGAVRVFLLHHATFSINSLCHSSGGGRSPPAISHATWPGSRRSPSGRPGTTITTPSRPLPVTAWAAGRSIPAPGSSSGSSAATWPGTSSGSAPSASWPSVNFRSLLGAEDEEFDLHVRADVVVGEEGQDVSTGQTLDGPDEPGLHRVLKRIAGFLHHRAALDLDQRLLDVRVDPSEHAGQEVIAEEHVLAVTG